MKERKFLLFMVALVVVIVGIFMITGNTASEEMHKVEALFPDAGTIRLVKEITDDFFVTLHFPGVQRAYRVDGVLSAFVVSSVGYNGPIDMMVAIKEGALSDVVILEHEETEDYAKYIEEEWFLTRFKNILVQKYLNRVVLDKENPEDIIQVTGATISSQAVINGVNAAIGAYQYFENGVEMDKVADVVPQEMWQMEDNSFSINWAEGSIRIDLEKIKTYEQIEMDAVLVNTTGSETEMHVKGPTLEAVLEAEGIKLSEYQGIGITGRDGYYTLIDREKFEVNPIILGWEFDGKPIREDEKPIRIVFPNEMGPYWVKMVMSIDLYKDIAPKDITSVHLFDPLTSDIEPYYYEYYGSKDKSIEIGKILNKFSYVDQKGFFTMTSVDGLVKNETLSLVRQRYYIKVEGENAPMNIAPNFKLGMNVKNICCFSTSTDAVIFPEKMSQLVRTTMLKAGEGLSIEDILLLSGMRWTEEDSFRAVNTKNEEFRFSSDEVGNLTMLIDGDKVDLYKAGSLIFEELMRIDKNEN
ncbi:MAG: FMN-binding protein [Vallitaleaceae bacterium]|nr:FMN-binding protein [Vallitaleaceae bacterium]